MSVGIPVYGFFSFRGSRCWGSLNLPGLLVRAVVFH